MTAIRRTRSFRPTVRRLAAPLLVYGLCAPGLAAAPDDAGASAASPPDTSWAIGIGGENREYLTDLAVDGDRGLYLAGHFLGRFEGGPAGAHDAVGDADGLLVALTVDGTPRWARRFGGPGADEARAVAVGPAGEIYVAGFFSETIDFDAGPRVATLTSAGSSDVVLARFDREGDLEWVRSFGGAFGDVALDLAVAPSGVVHLAGYFQGTVDFDPGEGTTALESAGGTDAFHARFDSTGELLGAVSFGGATSDEARGVAVDADGGVRLCGLFRGRASWSAAEGASGDPEGRAVESAGSSDAFLARLDASGAPRWLRRWGGPSADSCNAVAAAADGGLAAAGRFAGEARGDGEGAAGSAALTSGGSTDAWVLRLDGEGVPRWVHSVGEKGSDFGFGVALTADRVWVTGFLQPVFGGAGPAETRSFLAGFDDAGSALERRVWSATTGIQAIRVAVDPAGRPVVAGVFDGDAELDPGSGSVRLPGAGKVDLFVARFAGW